MVQLTESKPLSRALYSGGGTPAIELTITREDGSHDC
jgi:hypothetical protein